MTVVPRVGGRVLVVDRSERVLLIHERLEHGGTHWLTPGGGVEPGERPQDAARREAYEEVGLDVEVPADADAVLVTRRDWSWAGVEYDQVDHFFLVRVSDGVPTRPRRLTSVERRTWLGVRWWSAAELRATDAVLLPPDLGHVLPALLGPGE